MESKLINTINNKIDMVKVINGISDCSKCMFYNEEDCYETLEIYGLQCSTVDCYYVKHVEPEKWIQCTPENIRVGDTISHYSTAPKYNVDHLLNNGYEVLIQWIGHGVAPCMADKMQYVALISRFKKLVLI